MDPEAQYCLLGIDRWWACMSVTLWAAWAQAIGSVAAIAGAAYGVHRAHALRERAREKAEFDSYTQFLYGLYEMVVAARTVAQEVCEAGSPFDTLAPDEKERLIAEMASIRDGLSRFELGRLDRPSYVAAWRVTDSWTRQLSSAVEHLRSQGREFMERGQLQLTASRMVEQLIRHEDKLDKGIQARGGVIFTDRRPD